MKALIVCPAERPAVGMLAETRPLAILPVFGKPLIVHWIEHLALQGATQIHVLATDRPDRVRNEIGDGRRWGLRLLVIPERREPTLDEAREKYQRSEGPGWLAAPLDAVLLNHFPGLPGKPLFDTYAGFFDAVKTWMPNAAGTTRVGIRELQPGVWIGLRSRIAPSAQLLPPCWIGEQAWISPQAVIGPNAVLENRVVIDSGAEVRESMVGPETYVGELTDVRSSLAQGGALVNWERDSRINVPDAFLMCDLGRRRRRPRAGSLLGRTVALGLLLATLPVASVFILRARFRKLRAFRSLIAVRPHALDGPVTGGSFIYHELANCAGRFRMWPQLWNIVRGEFAWVGNRPLSPAEAATLTDDFERLWLAAPIGLFSLAEADGAPGLLSGEARASSSFYAVQANWKLDLSILCRILFKGNQAEPSHLPPKPADPSVQARTKYPVPGN